MKKKYSLLARLYNYNKKSYVYFFKKENQKIKIFANDYISALNILKLTK
jgi:hypothetical protein